MWLRWRKPRRRDDVTFRSCNAVDSLSRCHRASGFSGTYAGMHGSLNSAPHIGTEALLSFGKLSKTLLVEFPEENLEWVQEPPHEEELFFAVPHLHPIIAAAAPAEVEPADQAVDQIHSMAGSSRPMPLNIHDCQVGDVLLATQDVDISYRDVSIVQGCELRIARAVHSGSIRCTYYIGKKLLTVYLNEKECELFVRR